MSCEESEKKKQKETEISMRSLRPSVVYLSIHKWDGMIGPDRSRAGNDLT